MAVTVLCPNLKCRAVLAVPEEARGKKVRCKYCGMTFVVPAKEHNSPPKKPENPVVTE
jgi:hypothetical protein